MNQTFSSQSEMHPFDPAEVTQPVLKVLGLGGGGCNAVERMMALGIKGVDFIAANTDKQVLNTNPAPTHILLGPNTTRGLGSGGDPRRGREAAEESRKELATALAGADMVFLTAGMGGGTGTGSIPVAAEIARSQGAVTVGVVTTPFAFEMGRRQKNASEGITQLREHTHTLIAIPNDRLLYVAPRNLPMETAFRLADDVLRQAVQGITELITEPGLINVDFAHIRRMILMGGGALLSMGQGQGEDKASQALEQALHHPLLDTVTLTNAAGVIANFTGGEDLSLLEIQAALSGLQAYTGPNTEIVMGAIQDERMEGRAQVILLITGIGAPTLEEAMSSLNKAAPHPVRERSNSSAQPVPVERQPVNIGAGNSGGARPAERSDPAPAAAAYPAGEPRSTPESYRTSVPGWFRPRSR
jgi:cell division protein FtsZ